MSEPTEQVAYWNGCWVPRSSLRLSVDDLGFLMGATVAERLRTFGGRLFRLREHWERLEHSLTLVGGRSWVDLPQLASVSQELVDTNAAFLDPEDDQGLVVFVTPGVAGGEDPTVCLYSDPLPFHQWVRLYEFGQKLVTASPRQVPPNCWPPSLKCRSRMHYYLADLEARRQDAASRALILDQRGYIAEATTANIVFWFPDEGLVTPRAEYVLPGVSLAVVEELAKRLGLRWTERDIAPHETASAEEAFLCSTSPCLIPVSAIDGTSVGGGHPGPMFARLMAEWSRWVGCDIPDQARRFAAQRTSGPKRDGIAEPETAPHGT